MRHILRELRTRSFTWISINNHVNIDLISVTNCCNGLRTWENFDASRKVLILVESPSGAAIFVQMWQLCRAPNPSHVIQTNNCYRKVSARSQQGNYFLVRCFLQEINPLRAELPSTTPLHNSDLAIKLPVSENIILLVIF